MSYDTPNHKSNPETPFDAMQKEYEHRKATEWSRLRWRIFHYADDNKRDILAWRLNLITFPKLIRELLVNVKTACRWEASE